MAVSLLDSFVWAGENIAPVAFSVSPGSNRLAFVGISVGSGVVAEPPTSVSLGGQAMTKAVEAADVAGSADVATTVWMLTESEIQAMAGSDIVIGGGSYTAISAYTWSLQGAEQAVPTNKNTSLSYATTTDPILVPLTRVADGWTVALTSVDSTGGATASTNPALVTQATHAPNSQYGSESSIDETVNFSYTPGAFRHIAITVFNVAPAAVTPTTRKGFTFDIETTLGTITTATLNAVNVFDHLTVQDATTATFAGAVTDEITTSGQYDLVLGDGTVTETITIQVNVYGVAPSNNPVQKDGAALASLTGVQVRVTAGSNLDGTQLEYLPTATTDASGNLSSIDLSSTAAADTDPVLLHMRTAAGDNIIASETVGLI